MEPRAILNSLRYGSEAARHEDDPPMPRRFIGNLPLEPVRPLGAFSDYVCAELGTDNQRVYEKSMSAGELFDRAEVELDRVEGSAITDLVRPERWSERRIALLDVVWTLRSLDIAHTDDPNFRERKAQSRLFDLAQKLARIERRHPVLLWSDIAIYHPVHDPRTFLSPGRSRDEEVLMYRVQSALERLFKGILEMNWQEPSVDMLREAVQGLRAALRGLMHYSRARTVGQFYQLDPYLRPNFEYRGHATGSFSVWTFLMGIFFAGNRSFTRRLRDEANRKAFDRDADPYIDSVIEGKFRTLDEHLAAAQLAASEREEADALRLKAREAFTFFLHSHRGAIKRHAEASFAEESPSDPRLTNAQSIREAIGDMAVS